jgi:hypothetical protein
LAAECSLWSAGLPNVTVNTILRIKSWLHVCAERIRPIYFLLFFLGLSTARDLWLLFRFPVAVGIDGYHYLLEIESVRRAGVSGFLSPRPLVVYFLTAISFFTRNDLIAGKVGAILLHLALVAGGFVLVRQITGSDWLGVVGSVWVAISGLHLYMIGEFINNLGALTLFVWCGWCVIMFVKTRRIVWSVMALALVVGALLSHRSAPIIALLVLGLVLVQTLLAKSNKKYHAPILVLLVMLWITPALLAWQHALPLPPDLMVAFSTVPTLPFDHYAFPEEVALLLVSLAIQAVLLKEHRHAMKPTQLLLGAVALFSVLVSLNPFLKVETGWLSAAERLRGVSYIQLGILLPGLIWLLVTTNRKRWLPYAGALIIPLIIGSVRLPLPRGLESGYLYRRQELIASLGQIHVALGPAPLIIAPHGDQFVVTAITGVPSQQTPPQSAQYDKVYWLLNDVTDPVLRYNSIPLLQSDNVVTILVEDNVFKEELSVLGDSNRSLLLRSNPHVARYVSSSQNY